MTPARVLAAEATRLVGLTWVPWLLVTTAATAVLTSVVLGLLAAPGARAPAGQVVTAGHPVLGLGLLALGALVGAGDFTTGAAVSSYAAVPRRLPVLGAQAVLTAAAALVTAALAVAGAVLGAAVATGGAPAATGVALDPGDLVADGTGLVLHVTGLALLGVGLGALLRHPGPALVLPVVLVLLVDPLLAANAGPVTDVVRGLLPAAGTALFAATGPAVGAVHGALVLVAWVVAVLGAAAVRLRAGDVR